MRVSIAIVAACAALYSPAQAQAQACYSLSATLNRLSIQGAPHAVLAPDAGVAFVRNVESRIGFHFPTVRNVLIADLGNGIFYGLEINGCLTPPQPVLFLPPSRRSGMTPAGVFA